MGIFKKRKFSPLVYLYLLVLLGVNTIIAQGNNYIEKELLQLVAQGKLEKNDIINWKLTNESTSTKSGIKHYYYVQTMNGLPIKGTEGYVHITDKGKLLSRSNNFVSFSTLKTTAKSQPNITALQALNNTVKHLGIKTATNVKTLKTKQNSNIFRLQANGISKYPITATLEYVLKKETKALELTWEVYVKATDLDNAWNVSVNALTGKVMTKVDCTFQCFDESDAPVSTTVKTKSSFSKAILPATVSQLSMTGNYEVFALPDESPEIGARIRRIVPNPRDGQITGSPFGWHDVNGVSGAEFTTTRGNNVNVFENGDNVGFSPDGGSELNFTTSNTAVDYRFFTRFNAGTQSEPAALTNLFYLINTAHDIFYEYGFDEASGNFQQTNYSGNGFGNDALQVEAHERCGAAYLAIRRDGEETTFNIGACFGVSDGAFDNSVVLHEYSHGLTYRLTGGSASNNCLTSGEAQGMGEGWSDWYAMMFTLKTGDTDRTLKTLGTWIDGQAADGEGIRRLPYTTDLSVNPLTYRDSETERPPHGIGIIWASMLWDLTWDLIDAYGFDSDLYNFTGNLNNDAGNIQALAIVTEALKLQPCEPGFVDARNAILLASEAIYGNANECLIWEAFAKRGLGYSAQQGESNNLFDNIEAFDVPSINLNIVAELCANDGVQVLSGAQPEGGIFSGIGVTDNADGKTFNFDPAIAGVGTHVVTYTAPSPRCETNDTTATSTIEVTGFEPEISCRNINLMLDSNGTATLAYQDVVTNLEEAGYDVDQTGVFAPINIRGSRTPIELGFQTVSIPISIGFPFTFYGEEYTELYVTSNGLVTFGENPSTGRTSAIPSADGIDNLIAAGWGTFFGPIFQPEYFYQIVGDSPNRIMIIDFDSPRWVPFAGSLESQVHLFEGSNKIEIHTTEIDTGQRGELTQGIENANGTLASFVEGRVDVRNIDLRNDYVAFIPALPKSANNCGAETTIALSKTNFTTNDIGNNNVRATISDTKGNRSTCNFVVTVIEKEEKTLDISNHQTNSANVDVYPNPTNGEFYIKSTDDKQLKTIKIYNVLGAQVKTINMETIPNEFSLEGLPTGLYFIHMFNGIRNTIKSIVKE